MLTLGQSALEVSLPNLSGELCTAHQYHYVWLRDNCPCRECTHPETKERILVTSEIDAEIAPNSAEVNDSELCIEWNQARHTSSYSLDWLSRHSYGAAPVHSDPGLGGMKLWGSEFQDSIPSFDYQALYDDPNTLLKWCEAVRDYGLAIVRGAPLEEGEIERFACYVGVVRETIFDRLHDVRATPDEYNAYNVASTTLELKPHTDMPCYNNPPGVQMFHFLVNETEGGESTAVDGFHVAAKLKESNPQAYRILANTPINFRMFSVRGDVQTGNPILALDSRGELKVFRFSNQLAQTMCIPSDQMADFYDAYRALGQLIESPENKVEFRLNTGDMMVTDNLRVMHGRNSYDAGSGQRHLQLSYLDMDDVVSRIRMIKKGQSSLVGGSAE